LLAEQSLPARGRPVLKKIWVVMLGFVAILTAAGAEAQATRTWVSGVGDDANPCSRTAPCKTFAGAISKTAAKGEINTLDPGGYGAVTITKSITIANDGNGTAGVLVSGTNGIVINAASTDVVVLRGLDIQGVGTGLNGIRFLSGAALFVENCTINGFTQRGIDFTPAAPASLLVKDSVIRNNPTASNGGGILVKPGLAGSARVVLDGVRLERNLFGLRVEDNSSVVVRNSSASDNENNGFLVFSAAFPSSLTLENVVTSVNRTNGVSAVGLNATARISNVTITGNLGTGLSSSSGGVIISFGNNQNSGNVVQGSPTTTEPRQ
jgi:hypothetical protein